MNSTTTTRIDNPDSVNSDHTCDTAVLDGLLRPVAEARCPACPSRFRVPAQRTGKQA